MMTDKKAWTTPELVIFGTVEKITKSYGGIPPKTFGSADGASYNGQEVQWAS